ncbi:hypothetical protein I312_106791 [Cryptococcus bacillisporus CA1280]|uniref:uncharacterized protein n=1 Tax=Cryptococcus bacillisporus CA1280 TaxID=1296109 RepID=UPI00336849DA
MEEQPASHQMVSHIRIGLQRFTHLRYLNENKVYRTQIKVTKSRLKDRASKEMTSDQIRKGTDNKESKQPMPMK